MKCLQWVGDLPELVGFRPLSLYVEVALKLGLPFNDSKCSDVVSKLSQAYPVNNYGWPNAAYVPERLALAALLWANKGPTWN